MSLSPSNPKDLLDYALRLCADNSHRMNAIASSDDARRVALGIVADATAASAGSAPLGLELLRRPPALSSPLQRAPVAPTNANSSATSSNISLKKQSPGTGLARCPYCDDPGRRFCPESGRRHETGVERSQRLWRSMFRSIQFSCRISSAERLEKPNTCSEEFFVEL
jgi:hypothetical protein